MPSGHHAYDLVRETNFGGKVRIEWTIPIIKLSAAPAPPPKYLWRKRTLRLMLREYGFLVRNTASQRLSRVLNRVIGYTEYSVADPNVVPLSGKPPLPE